tara:strand:- start:4698 stop:5003 length:306 start_codon:yes stop_codon:yes gene_type:complete
MIIINIGVFGLIPSFIKNLEDPFWKQVDKGYAHGGGWIDFEGFEVLSGDADAPYSIQSPEAPIFEELGRIQTDDQVLIMLEHEWVLWQDLNTEETKIARID